MDLCRYITNPLNNSHVNYNTWTLFSQYLYYAVWQKKVGGEHIKLPKDCAYKYKQMFIYAYAHKYSNTLMQKLYIYAHTHKFTNTYIHTYKYINTLMPTDVHLCTHTYTSVQIHWRKQMYVYAHIPVYNYIILQVSRCTCCTHTHTRIQVYIYGSKYHPS